MANNYTLGRGELHFAQFKPNTRTPGGERYIGNSPEFTATIENENLDHFNSDRGVREKDESIALQTNRTATFTTDNVSPENLALFFFGSKTALTSAGGPVSDEAFEGVEKGLSYQLGATNANPAGARNVSTVVIKDEAEPATTFTEGTDYTVDLTLGRFTVLEGGAITEGANLLADYEEQGGTRERVVSGSQAIEGQLRYIAYNPAGKQFDWVMPWVKITPNGDFALKGDEWQTIPFTVEILRKEGLEAIYIDGRPLAA